MSTIHVELPYHLRTLANAANPVLVEVEQATLQAVLDEVERRYPMLRGTIREHVTLTRRPYLRFFADQRDISLQALNAPLPARVADGVEPLIILGSVAGG